MDSLLDLVTSQLSSGGLRRMSGRLGVGEGDLEQAIPSALAILTGGLARNAERPDGARALEAALERDHDGSILDLEDPSLLGAAKALDGDGILGHILGDRRGVAEQAVSRASGLDAQTMSQLLGMLAPLVMGALGRARRRGNLDAGGLADLLGRERRRVERAAPTGMGDVLSRLLDADDDGSVLDDVARLGSGLLGGLLGGRK